MIRLLLCSAIMAVALTSGAGAQTDAPPLTLRFAPADPPRGSAAWLVVLPDSTRSNDSLVSIDGEAAGEPLHFSRAGRALIALVGVPLEGPDSLELVLRVERRERSDTTRVVFGFRTPDLEPERLQVAPSMASFDSATAARIDRELAQSRALSRRAQGTPRRWRLPFRTPRPGRVTSVFGTPREYNGTITSRHLGTDFAGKVGAPVTAAARGVVALVAHFYLAGHAVYLDHGEGLVTGYFHLSRIDVAEGDVVAAGQRIGGVGRSGRVTGPHLHWIARYGAVTIDPMSLVRLPHAP